MFLAESNGALKEDAGLVKQQQEIQNKILSVLGEHTSPTAKPSDATFEDGSSPDDVKMKSPVSTKIDLSSPGLQKALNTLISNSGGLLKNLPSSKTESEQPPSASPTADDNSPYSSHSPTEYDQPYEPSTFKY